MLHSRTPSVGFLTRHPKYYIENADLHIVAEHTLFRVHGYFFSRESPIFNRKINPASPGDVREGSTDKDPVVLQDVTPEEFEKLLWVFYNPKYSIYETTVEEWNTILNLADKFDFPEVKELVVRELHKKPAQELPLIDKMALYSRYKVDARHLVPLYSELCERDTPLSLEESKILGLEAAVLIANAREKLRAKPSDGGRSPLPVGMEKGDVFRAIERELGVTEGATEEFRAEHGLNTPPGSGTTPMNGSSISRYMNGSSTRGNRNGRGAHSRSDPASFVFV